MDNYEVTGSTVGRAERCMREISHVLSKMRAPAFYGEVVYSEEEAKRVMQEGKWVMVRLRRWLEEVGWRSG